MFVYIKYTLSTKSNILGIYNSYSSVRQNYAFTSVRELSENFCKINVILKLTIYIQLHTKGFAGFRR